MREPTVSNNENLVTVVTTGTLSKGGIITSSPDVLIFSFACTSFKESKTDFEVNLTFQNNDVVNLYFSKECDTTADVQEYFSFFYTIYYILLLVFFGFVITILYYYFRSNEITAFDIYLYGKNRVMSALRYMTNKMDHV
jgi:hypothetical protein